jgi:hypothetical protein
MNFLYTRDALGGILQPLAIFLVADQTGDMHHALLGYGPIIAATISLPS